MKKGKLIIIEGADFAGKTSCINKIKSEKYPLVFTREPGNNLNLCNETTCNAIRNTLLTEKMSVEGEALLFATSRYLHTLDMLSILNNGYDVLCDRYYISSLCYQAPRIGFETVYNFNKPSLDLLKQCGCEVHNIILNIDYDTYKKRSQYRPADAMEQVSANTIRNRIKCLNDVNESLKNSDLENWIENLHYVDATKAQEDVQNEVKKIINKIIG